MSRRLQENIVALIIMGFFAFELYLSLDFSPRARLVPVPISALGLILITCQLIWQNFQSESELNIDVLEFITKKHQVQGAADATPEDSQKEAASTEPDETAQRTFVALGMVVGFVALILLIGPIPSIFIFTAAYFVFSGYYTPLKGIGIATVFTAGVYLLFVGALDLQLYHGVLQPVMDWYYEAF